MFFVFGFASAFFLYFAGLVGAADFGSLADPVDDGECDAEDDEQCADDGDDAEDSTVAVCLAGQPLDEVAGRYVVRVFGTVRQQFRTPVAHTEKIGGVADQGSGYRGDRADCPHEELVSVIPFTDFPKNTHDPPLNQ